MSLEALLERAFRLYYEVSPCLEEPPNIAMREFAFQLFGREGYVRHISFETYDEMIEYVRENTPRQAYYSVALYELPEAGSMEEKSWLGSWLLFDIDLDHAEACSEVIEAPKGALLGDTCLLEGYRMARKLEAMIRRDLAPESVTIYFTGNRGFHLRVECSQCMMLGREERREIALYIAGEGVEPRLIFPSTPRRGRSRVAPAMPSPEDPGWRGWIAPVLRARLQGSKSLGVSGWESIVADAVREARIPIDVMVTQDPSRLTRILGSLNGKGSLLAVDATAGFKPDWRKLSPFRGEVDVRLLRDIDSIRILGERIAGRKGETLHIPSGVALHLAVKGIVEVLGGEISVGKGACRRPV